VTEADVWSDDPRLTEYNRHIVIRPNNPPDNYTHEKMSLGDFAYRCWLIEIRHNSDPPVPGAGSAIFFHIRRGVNRPTTGAQPWRSRPRENHHRLGRRGTLVTRSCPPQNMTRKWQAWESAYARESDAD